MNYNYFIAICFWQQCNYSGSDRNNEAFISMGFPNSKTGKEYAFNAGNTGDMGSIHGSGRSLGGGNGNPLQHCCLKNPVDREAWKATVHEVAKRWT